MNIKKYFNYDYELSQNTLYFVYSLIAALVIYNLIYLFSFQPDTHGKDLGIFLAVIAFIILLFYVIRQNLIFGVFILVSIFLFHFIEKKVLKKELRILVSLVFVLITHVAFYWLYQSFYSIKI